MRRLLENGANTSFVNRIVDETAPIDEIVADPVARLRKHTIKPHPRIPLPRNLFGAARRNSPGHRSRPIRPSWDACARRCERAAAESWSAAPLLGGVARSRRTAGRSPIPPTAAASSAR